MLASKVKCIIHSLFFTTDCRVILSATNDESLQSHPSLVIGIDFIEVEVPNHPKLFFVWQV